MCRCIISYQESLCSLLKNVNHQAHASILCNHSINGQLLWTSVLSAHLCFGALWNFCLSLSCDSWAIEGKLFFWIILVLCSLLGVILNTCFGSLIEFYVFLFYSPIFSITCLRLLWGRLKSLIWAPHIRKSVPCELLLLCYIILQMAQRKKRDHEGIKSAIEAIRNKEMGSYKASRFFNVPQTTLESYVKERQKSSSETVKTKLGRNQVLPCEAENNLADHCLLMDRKFFGLTIADLMRLAYQLAVRNRIRKPFLQEKWKGWKEVVEKFPTS